jgi:hypothetical protein
MAPALSMTMLFPVLTIALVPFIGAMFRDYCGPALAIMSAIFFIITRKIVRRKTGAAAVGSYLLAVHLAVVIVATFWTWHEAMHGAPILSINPAAMTILSLVENSAPRNREIPHWERLQSCYIAALAVNIFYVRRWAIRNFDRLAGRCGDTPPPADRSLQSPESRSTMPAVPEFVAQSVRIEKALTAEGPIEDGTAASN